MNKCKCRLYERDALRAELARRDEYISKLEAKIPKLNIDLAEACTHAYNGESARMKLEAELARLTAELAELNDKAVFIQFENEDELPADISNDVYSTMFNCSHVDGVRLFPYIEENGQKYFFVMLREDE